MNKPNSEGKPVDSGADWGLSKRTAGMTRETKIGLVLILVLAGAFGFVVVRKMQRQDDLLAEDVIPKKKHVEPIPPYDGTKKTGTQVHTAQHEPNLSKAAERSHEFPSQFPAESESSDPGHTDKHDGQSTGNPFHSTTGDRGTTTVKSDGSVFGGQTESGGSSPFPGGSTAGHDVTVGGAGDSLDSGSGSGHGHKQPSGVATGSPFAKQDSHGHSDDGHATRLPTDGFQNASNTTGSPFGEGGQSGYPNSAAGSHDGHSQGTVSEAPRGLFGDNLDRGHAQSSIAKTTVADDRGHGTDPPDDPRLGAFNVGTTRPADGHDSTTVQAGGTKDDLQYPFGRPAALSQKGHAQQATSHVHDLPATTDRPRIHTVQPGDNYWTISRKAYGTGVYYHALAAYNRHRIPDPKRMRPKMKVLVPTVKILAKRFPALCPRSATGVASRRGLPGGFFRDRSGSPMYRVGKTDTLSGIAQKHLGRGSRWIQVYRLNAQRIKNPNRLTIGTELRLPADASNIRLVSEPSRYR